MDLPNCPVKHDCKNRCHYSQTGTKMICGKRKRRKDNLFECPNFDPTELTNPNKLPEPDIELFPEFDYAK